jgi:hypothetical protein
VLRARLKACRVVAQAVCLCAYIDARSYKHLQGTLVKELGEGQNVCPKYEANI